MSIDTLSCLLIKTATFGHAAVHKVTNNCNTRQLSLYAGDVKFCIWVNRPMVGVRTNSY